jgi:zinc protease
VLDKLVTATAYNWHNYGKPTIGNRTDIERVPVDNLRAFYKKYYQPDNIVVLVVAGKFERPRPWRWSRNISAPSPVRSASWSTTYTEEPPQEGERTVVLRRVGDVGVVDAAYHMPAGPHEDSAALQVLANILSTQPSGRLYKALVETKKAASARAFAGAEHDPGLFELEAEVPKENSLEEVENLMLTTAETLAERASRRGSQPRQEADSQSARNGRRQHQPDRRLAQRMGRARRLAPLFPAPRPHRTSHPRSRAGGGGQISSAQQSHRWPVHSDRQIGKGRCSAHAGRGRLVADYKGRAAMAQGEAFEATPANIESRVRRLDLPEGIKATLLEKKSRGQEVHLSLTLHYGNEENLKGFESAAGFLPELMMRGTQKLTYQQLRDELDAWKRTWERAAAAAGDAAADGVGRRGRRTFHGFDHFFDSGQTRHLAGCARFVAPGVARAAPARRPV